MPVTRIAGSLSSGSPFRRENLTVCARVQEGKTGLLGTRGSVVTFVTSRIIAVYLRKGAPDASNDAPGSAVVKAEPPGTGDAIAESRSVMHVQMQMRRSLHEK